MRFADSFKNIKEKRQSRVSSKPNQFTQDFQPKKTKNQQQLTDNQQ